MRFLKNHLLLSEDLTHTPCRSEGLPEGDLESLGVMGPRIFICFWINTISSKKESAYTVKTYAKHRGDCMSDMDRRTARIEPSRGGVMKKHVRKY